jgi:uncharacterized protein YjbI with pentapeptide repeats
MGAKFRSWWKKTRRPIAVIGLIVVLVVAIALIFVEVRVFGTGFTGKTLWDWLQLLIIPAVLAVGGYLFNYTTSKNERAATAQRAQSERDIALDNQREVALQAYIDKMSELLLEKQLRESTEHEVRNIARIQTLTILPRLDAQRKRSVLQFLFEAGLIDTDKKRIVDLSGADLSGADLSGIFLVTNDPTTATMSGANLRGANLRRASLKEAVLLGANLSGANLSDVDLSRAVLSEANLRRANLSNADLSDADLGRTALSDAKLNGANLCRADLSGANLHRADLTDAMNITIEELEKKVTLLQGATMPDGSKHE